MLHLREGVLLADHTTFHIGGPAEFFAEAMTVDDVREAAALAHERNIPLHLFGGGSNVLVSDEGLSGLSLRIAIEGYTETDAADHVIVRAGAGMIFDALVARTVERGLWGLENLSSIPGSVGATPVQNVGAYGVEIASLIDGVEAYDLETDAVRTLSPEECKFGYRHSVFKEPEGKRYVITHVSFRLSRTPRPILEYRDLKNAFGDAASSTVPHAAVRDAVIAIRAGKFPDWTKEGTAGSFFKNPVVSKEVYAALSSEYPNMPAFPSGEHAMKLSLAWILDNVCGMRGVREGKVGTYSKQALVIVNFDNATAEEVKRFAQKIKDLVKKKINIDIECEVSFVE